jgi:hypothetical protein
MAITSQTTDRIKGSVTIRCGVTVATDLSDTGEDDPPMWLEQGARGGPALEDGGDLSDHGEVTGAVRRRVAATGKTSDRVECPVTVGSGITCAGQVDDTRGNKVSMRTEPGARGGLASLDEERQERDDIERSVSITGCVSTAAEVDDTGAALVRSDKTGNLGWALGWKRPVAEN